MKEQQMKKETKDQRMDKRIEDGQKNKRWAKEQRMGKRIEDVQIKKGTRSDPRSRAAIARAADFLAGGCKI